MNRNERLNDLQVSVSAALDGRQAEIWTAIPALVVDVDYSDVTISAQPAIQSVLTQKDGTTQNITLPLLIKVPICYPKGGGFAITFPIKKDDEVLIIFSSRCIDAWWQQGGVQPQAEMRMHDLSDGFAILAPQSQAKKISNISQNSIQMRSDDGATYISVADNKNVTINTTGNLITNGANLTATLSGSLTASCSSASITATSNINLTAPQINLNGNVSISGSANVVGGLTNAGTNYATHVHGGVQTGAGTTGVAQ